MRDPNRSQGHPGVGGAGHVSLAAASSAYAHASSLASELLAHTLRPNVLVIGPVARSEATLSAIVGALSTPVRYWTQDVQPPALGEGATIVIRDVATLPLSLQEAWLARLNAPQAHHTQIIATSSIAVFPLVLRRTFLEDLYYRLNTVLLDVRRSPRAEE
jgi:hypothetical protein